MSLDEESVAQRQAALHGAVINLGYTDVVAPIGRIVVSRNVEIGQTVTVGSGMPSLFLIGTDLATMQVEGNVGENDIGKVKLGDKASFTVDAFPNRLFAGEVIKIGRSPPTIQSDTIFDAIISAVNPDLLLEPGMAVVIRIVVERRDEALRAPNQALRYSPDGLEAGPRTTLADGSSQLWVLRDGKLTAITVQLGLDDGNYTEIVKGDVQSGDELIISEDGGMRR